MSPNGLSHSRGAMINGSQPDHQQVKGPFNDPTLDRYYAAVMAGDSNLADRIAAEFSQSPEGQRMIQQGNELYAQQQMEQQRQLQEQQVQQQGPALVRTLNPQPHMGYPPMG